jgi:predicted ArsR family transcriptional regulator
MTEEPLTRLAPLADPVRRRLYDFVAAQADAVDRDAAAAGVGVGRPLAAFHLDRLVRAGLLEAIYRRRSGRTGPGAGRPAKFYRRPAHEEISVSLPPRRYDALADLLAEAVEPSVDARDRALELARARGEAIAAAVPPETPSDRDGLVATLAENGYEPTADADGSVHLRNCPFDRLAAAHRELTCSLNMAMLSAVEERFPDAGLEPVAEPRNGNCCVAFLPDG